MDVERARGGSDNRANSSAPWQPGKDLPWRPTAADWHSNIGMFKHQQSYGNRHANV